MKTNFTKKQMSFVQAARAEFGNDIDLISREEVLRVCKSAKMKSPQWLFKDEYKSAKRGVYYLPYLDGTTALDSPQGNTVMENVVSIKSPVPVSDKEAKNRIAQYDNMIPERDKNFVRFGIYSDLKTIIQSEVFYPVFISGLSGNGKSMIPEQICAELKREFFRVNIQKNTNEDDLIGGFRLVNGETVWHDGPVTQAAERGGVLLLDEIDYGSAEITCLQNVLEGKPFLIKKVNRVVHPKKGFTIIATANTKGQGDNVGKFVFTNVLNEAFLERFSVTFEQDYPPVSVEVKILKNNFKTLGVDEADFSDFPEKLVKWAGTNRETYKNGGIAEVLSTRRLVHVVKAYTMFKDRKKSVQICLNRFDNEVKETLYDLYQKIDSAPVDNELNQSAIKKMPQPDADGGVPF